ncbi:hypothetical protein RND71_028379 [Anisodus tanguticus]|uniref:Uncharacterized protein n=1 Tax=Anisodus tanguticus TaxID=243964 RepID=A0AAE1RJN1_9SOLA|nr:hypothetical protein RND71_028379 [Anisodus tanguticus]
MAQTPKGDMKYKDWLLFGVDLSGTIVEDSRVSQAEECINETLNEAAEVEQPVEEEDSYFLDFGEDDLNGVPNEDDSEVDEELREENGSSGFSIGSSFRKSRKGKKEEELPMQENNEKTLHRFNHRIIVSDVVFKNRWSNVSSSDLIFLNSEMLNGMTRNRFSSMDRNTEQSTARRVIEEGQRMNIKDEMERKRLFESKIKQNSLVAAPVSASTSKVVSQRSMSEIIVHPRFIDFNNRNRELSGKEEEALASNCKENSQVLSILRKCCTRGGVTHSGATSVPPLTYTIENLCRNMTSMICYCFPINPRKPGMTFERVNTLVSESQLLINLK